MQTSDGGEIERAFNKITAIYFPTFYKQTFFQINEGFKKA